MAIDVCITADIEFTINGAFADPRNRRPAGPESVNCRADSRDCGLGFILHSLNEHELKGTFFVEAMNSCYFGDEPMGAIARDIASQGHDVQLHVHPVWTLFRDPDWAARVEREQIRTTTHDSLASLTAGQIAGHVSFGTEVFRRWGIPSPIAVRAGSLQVANSFYEALGTLKIPLASSIGFGVYAPNAPELHLFSGHHKIDSVVEVPVTSFLDVNLPFARHWKLATIVGMSFVEAKALLQRAHAEGVSPVVFLTHAHEFYNRRSDSYSDVEPNTKTQERFRRLCEFLAENPERYTVTTYQAKCDPWREAPSSANAIVATPLWRIASRYCGG